MTDRLTAAIEELEEAVKHTKFTQWDDQARWERAIRYGKGETQYNDAYHFLWSMESIAKSYRISSISTGDVEEAVCQSYRIPEQHETWAAAAFDRVASRIARKYETDYSHINDWAVELFEEEAAEDGIHLEPED